MITCDSCNERFSEAGDGYDGLCPTCADRKFNEEDESEMTHTPGPWHHGVDLRPDIRHREISSERRYVATVGADWGEETQANARLIAAAPALLEALENVLTAFPLKWWADSHSLGETEILKTAHNAIALARGEGVASEA